MRGLIEVYSVSVLSASFRCTTKLEKETQFQVGYGKYYMCARTCTVLWNDDDHTGYPETTNVTEKNKRTEINKQSCLGTTCHG